MELIYRTYFTDKLTEVQPIPANWREILLPDNIIWE